MPEDSFNVKTSASAQTSAPYEHKSTRTHSPFMFDIKTTLVYLVGKWRWILIVFFCSLIFSYTAAKIMIARSDEAWTASATVFHQTRSDRIPSFYKPIETATVMQFLNSRDAFERTFEIMRTLDRNFKKSLLGNVKFSINRTRKNIIMIQASANSPKIAADLANTIAQEGIREYVNRQNGTMLTMVGERRAQLEEIEREISAIQDEKLKYTKSSGLPPDEEIKKLRDEISTLAAQKNTASLKRQELAIQIANTEKILAKTPQQVVFEETVDNTNSDGLEGKLSELVRLRKRYTDENPKVIMLMDEIDELKKKIAAQGSNPPSRVTYRKNEVYLTLEMSLTQYKLGKDTIDSSFLKFDKEIEARRNKIASLMSMSKEYFAVMRRENSLSEKASKLSNGINDIEFLVNSAIPDVYILEAARIPSSSNITMQKIKIAAASIGITTVFIAGLLAWKLLRFKMLSSREFRLCFGISDVGEIPAGTDKKDIESAVMKIQRTIFDCTGNAKVISVLDFNPNTEVEIAVPEILNICAINGIKSFHIKLQTVDKRPKDSPIPEVGNLMLASVERFADSGIFYHQNTSLLDVAEFDLFKFDVNEILKEYDLVLIEFTCQSRTEALSAQIAKLSDACLITALFDKTGKFRIYDTVRQVRRAKNKIKIGGILTGVPENFYKLS